MNINDNVPFIFRQLRPKNMPKKTAEMITRLAKAYGLENIGEIDEQFLNGFTCASEIVIAQLENEYEQTCNLTLHDRTFWDNAIRNGIPLDDVKAEIEHMACKQYEHRLTLDRQEVIEILDNIGKAESEDKE